jgi:hypothetical protein
MVFLLLVLVLPPQPTATVAPPSRA